MQKLLMIISFLGIISATNAQYSTSSSDVYKQGEKVTVYFSGLPGNAKDWVAVTRADLPDNKYGEYFYTDGKKDGVFNFTKILPAGKYEVRTYYNWPDGGYKVQMRYPFEIKAKEKPIKTGYYVPMNASVNNQSDWKVRYRYLYGKSVSKWYYANAKSTGKSASESKSVSGLEVQWLDIATWKKLGFTQKGYSNYQQRGTVNTRVAAVDANINIKITGSVFPPKKIKLVE